MNDKYDVQKELKEKNYQLYINKLIIDLEKSMESLIMFYNNYFDSISHDVTVKIISLLDDKENDDKKSTVQSLVNAFFNILKEKLSITIEEKLAKIKNEMNNINNFNYEKRLNNEALSIINQISNIYQENIYMLIDELINDITNYRLDFSDYLLNTVYRKLLNTLRDKLMFSIKLINNNYDENTMILETINEKTLK